MGKHLTLADRHTLEILVKMKIPVAQIAQQLGCHRSTLYKELKRGKVELLDTNLKPKVVYQYDVGQRVRDGLARHKGRKRKLHSDDPFLQEISVWILERKYSPEAALYMVPEKKLCVHSLYNYIYAGLLHGVSVQSLPYARPKKKKSERTAKRLSRGRSIEDRPAYILDRKEYGHWEMDTVYSGKDSLPCLLVLSERMKRDEILIKMPDRTSKSVIHALNRLERRMGTPAFRQTFRSITCDNGVEFSDFKSIESSCRTKGQRTKLYYCHPYSSWERGTNENINRMIRRWIPKGDNIGLYSTDEIRQIQDWINSYPRPMFHGLSSQDMARLHSAAD